jgi:hypothetical protein
MTEHVMAWQCIGCGSIEAPQTCIGVCTHRKVEFVYAFQHNQIVAELEAARKDLEAARAFLRRFTNTTPHERAAAFQARIDRSRTTGAQREPCTKDHAWKTSYLALQEQARRMLDESRPPLQPPSTANATLRS